MTWPINFKRIPKQDWVEHSLEDLAMKYDTVEGHGWYDNLNFTVKQISESLSSEDILIDYSGGTGILSSRLLRIMKKKCPHIIIVDSSPKFLRLALDKFYTEKKVSFRLIPYNSKEKKLLPLDQIIDKSILKRGVKAIVSTNAIHLYDEIDETLKSWNNVLSKSGKIFIQSGNIRNPEAKESWIIDETVEHINKSSINIIKSNNSFKSLKIFLSNKKHMSKYKVLREKYFLPVKDLKFYTKSLQKNGFKISNIDWLPINAKVDEWFDFLSVYHEGVLGWVGGTEKIENKKINPKFISLRKNLIRLALDDIFKDKNNFQAAWTYITAEPNHNKI